MEQQFLTSSWTKSTKSPSCDNSCVEVRQVGATIEVRNSNDPTGPVTQFTPGEWLRFREGVLAGEFVPDPIGA